MKLKGFFWFIFQWYRPRSLVNLEDDTSSIWSGIGKSSSPNKEFSNTTQVNNSKLKP